ncbi:hypothetical protein [Mucilaginibacter arboris]|uniref:Uncharacterized protein n=1 Tax=Mucilaginibacter arboris TaxID=2682090 RepID=A0A7K1T1R8_9SPHI|nr:hypothetical protein [Mucilaginibacter arboris]MVN23499.1 hypothetical protein [Mucilaginibacter arboris]
MTLQKKIKSDLFVSALIFWCFISVVGYLFAFSKSEGTIGNGTIFNLIADYTLYAFPLIFLSDFLKLTNFVGLFVLLGTNILIYSFISTALFSSLVVKFKNYKPFLATYYSAMAVLIVIFIHFVYLISSSS